MNAGQKNGSIFLGYPAGCRALTAGLLAVTVTAAGCLPGAEDGEVVTWIHEDPTAGGAEGVASAAVLEAWPEDQEPAPIVVAVIDTGLDLAHEDLAGALWVNGAERNGRDGVDDDGNGYVDDLHGWNFLGGADGTAVRFTTRVLTRELRRVRTAAAADPENGELAERLAGLERRHAKALARARQRAVAGHAELALWRHAAARLGIDPDEATREEVEALEVDDPMAATWRWGMLREWGKAAVRRREADNASVAVRVWYDPDHDDRAAIGDDPDDPDQDGYGNPGVSVPGFDYHATHVAGIVAATRGNGRGIAGICPWAKIMVLRAVPIGDEHDKDVAAAIRYAVRNGAKIVNMSFGKEYPDDEAVVERAAAMALEHDVLLITGAGNSGTDRDAWPGHPNALRANATQWPHWLIVGASGRKANARLAAGFSNYGDERVHLFAPGVEIRSTIPGGKYDEASGTSMAAPVVAGVAALVWGRYPELSAPELREVLVDSARPYPDHVVIKPGTKKEKIPFAELSVAGGIVDARRALERARAVVEGKSDAERAEKREAGKGED